MNRTQGITEAQQSWALMWRQGKHGDLNRHLIRFNNTVLLFDTRAKAREYAEIKYGYIRKKKEFREAPQSWRMPIPVRVIAKYNY